MVGTSMGFDELFMERIEVTCKKTYPIISSMPLRINTITNKTIFIINQQMLGLIIRNRSITKYYSNWNCRHFYKLETCFNVKRF